MIATITTIDGVVRCARCLSPAVPVHPPFLWKCDACQANEPPPRAMLATSMPPSYGPGTELKKLLKKVGIEATPNCSCNARARTMDERGIEWCEANIDQIVGWLREEATNRGLPFVDMAGRMLVKRAIKNAKRSETTPPAAAG